MEAQVSGRVNMLRRQLNQSRFLIGVSDGRSIINEAGGFLESDANDILAQSPNYFFSFSLLPPFHKSIR